MPLANSTIHKGVFITFEGTEGSGKSTQIVRLENRLRKLGYTVKVVREPGGTPIGEEIRHTLKHSAANQGMTAETELLLLNASRAQLVREIVRPAIEAGEMVLCDRFYDSTIAYQGYGREMSMADVKNVIEVATGGISPNLTILLRISVNASEARRSARQNSEATQRDRFEEANRAFFERVETGFQAIAASEPNRIKTVDGNGTIEQVEERIWEIVRRCIEVPRDP
ncbi:MAG: dTMP kinase [Verrucomicrobia bacterium]|nr:dTMP kinase [Verrucomicrobiota bacterium]